MTNDQGPLILLVEDEADTRRLVRDLLVPQGYRVVDADNGYSALRAVENVNPDLVILDLVMPALDGFRVAEEVMEGFARRHLPILILSALSDEGTRERARSLGIEHYMEKPFSCEALLGKVAQILRRVPHGPAGR
jgi:DNA-binding response OmpR family regulator